MFLFSFIFLKKEKDWKGGEFNRAPLTKKKRYCVKTMSCKYTEYLFVCRLFSL